MQKLPNGWRKALSLLILALLVWLLSGWIDFQGTDGVRSVRAEVGVATDLLPARAWPVRLEDGYAVEERYAGRVVGRRRSDLGFERRGLLIEVTVDEGERVAAGQLLARLDQRLLEARQRELQARLTHTRASRREIEARLGLANVTVERLERQLRDDNVSRQSYDEARFEAQALAAQLAGAEAAIEQVQAALEVLAVELDQSRLRAPFAGSITARFADEGTAMEVGAPVLQLIEDQALEVKVGVPVRAVPGLEPGTRYPIQIEGRDYQAELRTLLAKIDPQTRTVTAIFRLDAQAGTVRAGELARLKLTQHIDMPGFWLPLTALTESRRGLWSAYALTPADTAQADNVMRLDRRELQLLHSETDRAFVRGTLRDGERVVASGVHRLVPGQPVRVVE